MQSSVPQQTGSMASAQRIRDHGNGPSKKIQANLPLPKAHLQPQVDDRQRSSIPAQSSGAHGQTALRQPHSQRQILPHKDQQSDPALSSGAGPLHQPPALPQEQLHVRSSPLYAASEGKDSESESSAGNVAQHRQQQAPQATMPKQAMPIRAASAHTSSAGNAPVSCQDKAAKQDEAKVYQPVARQTRAHSGQALRAAKPPTGRAQGRAQGKGQGGAQGTAPARHVEAKKGRKHTGEDDDQEGFGLLSEDEQHRPVRQTKVAQSKPGNTQVWSSQARLCADFATRVTAAGHCAAFTQSHVTPLILQMLRASTALLSFAQLKLQ